MPKIDGGYTSPYAGIGVVMLNLPDEGMAYVLPVDEAEVIFGAAQIFDIMIKNGGDDFAEHLARSEKMHILSHGSKGYKDLIQYEPGDVVIYIQLRKAFHFEGTTEVEGQRCYIVGSFFDNRDQNRKPPAAAPDARAFEFPDGTVFEYDHASHTFGMEFPTESDEPKDRCYLRYYADEGELMIKIKGDIKIEGNEIHLN